MESEHVAIGRVIAVKRRCGLGSRILSEGIRAARELLGADQIYLEAQTYAKGLYEKQGFRQISDEFLLDGTPVCDFSCILFLTVVKYAAERRVLR